MGIYDRDYYRQPSRRGGFGDFQMWSVNTWLILINVAVFLLDGILKRYLTQPLPLPDQESFGAALHRVINWMAGMGPLTKIGYFSMETAVYHAQLWRFITFQFLHANIQHIFWNMLGLYFFGPILEAHLQRWRYLAFYLLSGVGGGLGYMVLFAAGVLHGDAGVPLVGASAGIFGVLVGAAMIAPDIQFQLWFPPMPIRLKTMALIYIAFAAYNVLTSGANAGGDAGHLGGALVGLLLISNQQVLNFAHPRRPRMRYDGRKVAFKDWRNDPNR